MNNDLIQIKAIKQAVPVFERPNVDSPLPRSASYVVCRGIRYYKTIEGRDVEILEKEYNELLEIIKRRAGC